MGNALKIKSESKKLWKHLRLSNIFSEMTDYIYPTHIMYCVV